VNLERKIKAVKEEIAQASKLVNDLNPTNPELQELKSAAVIVAHAAADLNRLIGIVLAQHGRV